MSQATLEAAYRSLIVDSNVRALLINGPWGSGKTWFANKAAKQFEELIDDADLKYAYVSLFGVGSLAEVRTKLFLSAGRRAGWKKVFKLGVPDIKGLPLGKAAEIGRSILEDKTLRRLLVCLDDVERRALTLKIGDVYGLICELTQERDCKCLVLLNAEPIKDEEFRAYAEKVFDLELAFDPTPAEVVGFGLKDAADAAAALPVFERDGCSNIRVMQRVSWALGKVRELNHELVTKEWKAIVEQVSILCLCHFAHRDKLSNGFKEVAEWNSMVYLARLGFKRGEKTPTGELLTSLKYEPAAYDEALIELIETGSLSREKMLAGLQKEHDTDELGQIRQTHADLGAKYRSNFGCPAAEFIAELREYLRTHHEHIERDEVVSDCDLLLQLDTSEESIAVVVKALSPLYIHIPSEMRKKYGYQSYTALQKADVLTKIPYEKKISAEPIDLVFKEATDGNLRFDRTEVLAQFSDAELRKFLLAYREDDLFMRLAALFELLQLMPQREAAATMRDRVNHILDSIAATDLLHQKRIEAFLGRVRKAPP